MSTAVYFATLGCVFAFGALVGSWSACEHSRKTRNMVRRLDDIVLKHFVTDHGYSVRKKEEL